MADPHIVAGQYAAGRPRASAGRHAAMAIAMCTAAIASACRVGPEYVRPSVVVPSTYRHVAVEADAGPAGTAAAADAPVLAPVRDWWRAFGDAQLDALVTESLVANHDLRIATARVAEYAARVVETRSQSLPQVGYGAGTGRQRVGSTVAGTYSTLLSASWELDLWGRIAREDEAARATLLATEQARLGVALTLVSSVVAGYVTLLDLDRQLEVARATRDGRGDNVEVFQLRLRGGAVSDFEMLQVTAEYEAAVAAIPPLQRAIAQQEHALCVLAGRNPGPIARGGTLRDLVSPPVPDGLPSQLLVQRPDILQAEQQLVAANAWLGVARALYFPSLSLTGAGGSASTDLAGLFSGPARAWSFAGQLLGPLFAGGAIDAANTQAQARRDQAVEAYQQSIQSAFRDVDDALVDIAATRAHVAALERRVSALQRAVRLARLRYDNGYSDYLEVLDTERGLFSAELALSAARGDGYRALVDLYGALGGDWLDVPASVPGHAMSASQ